MTSQDSGFRFIDRGFKETLLLIPGWATDYRIFDSLDLDFNYLMPVGISPFDFVKKLLGALEENGLDKISIFGWSMGGFLASDFANRYPNRINEVILVGVKRKYDREGMEKIKVYLKKNRGAYLYSFYKDMFSEGEKDISSDFRQNLFKTYLDEMGLKSLLADLGYLSKAEIKPDNLEAFKVRFIHGQEDKIAPIEEALKIQGALPQARFISIEGQGHAPFLSSAFRRIFYEGHGR